MIRKAYLHDKVSIMVVLAAVNNSSFRGKDLEGILVEAEVGETTVDSEERHQLMTKLREELREKRYLS